MMCDNGAPDGSVSPDALFSDDDLEELLWLSVAEEEEEQEDEDDKE